MSGEAAGVILGPDGQPARGAAAAPPAPRGDGWSRSASGLWLDLREKAPADGEPEEAGWASVG